MIQCLLDAYKTLNDTGELPDEAWEEWLWKTDPEEAYSPEVLMNRCQLLGFLVCLYKGMQKVSSVTPILTDTETSRLTIMSRPVSYMSLRELKDTVENLQVEWPAFLKRLPTNPNAQANIEAVISLLDLCFARFGALCLASGDEKVMDDLGSIEPCKTHPGTFQITRSCIRRTVSTFMIFYRHLHLLAVARHVPDAWCDCGISKYHLEASGDDFNTICMHLSLPVAAKMNYKHDFPEMYNHVSQVVFFHNSEYQRIPRVKLEMLDSASPEQILPALMQLYPTISLKYEEDNLDLSSTQPATDTTLTSNQPDHHSGAAFTGNNLSTVPNTQIAADSNWWWLIVSGRIYLVDPDKAVWYSPNVTSLVKNVYLKHSDVAR